MTLPEVILWEQLRKGRLKGFQFRRQHPIGPYVLDFFCPSASLAIEVDGEGHCHPDQEKHDRVRDAWLRAKGIETHRIAAQEILNEESLPSALESIEAACRARLATGRRSPPPPLRGPPPP